MAKVTENVQVDSILVAARARQAELQSELARVTQIIETMGGETAPAPKTTSKGKRGRPKGSKNKPAAPKASRKKAKAKAKGDSKRGRPKGSRNKTSNGISLIQAVAQVLAQSNEPLTIAQITEGVEKLGYSTNADSFSVMISQTLGKLSKAKVAETVKRGVWQSSNGITSFLETFTTDEAEETADGEVATGTKDNIPI